MVWSLSYRPKAASRPRAEIVEGNTGTLELEDMTRDGGVALLGGSQSFSGRRAKAESVPKVIRWLSSRPLLDYETAWIASVNDRFRALIEAIEPGVHQFEPVDFIAKDRTPLDTRWFWQICNRLDSVKRGVPGWVLDGAAWYEPHDSGELPTFDLKRIGSAHFWHDKHLVAGTFVSDDAKARIEAEKITGVYFTYRQQA